MRPRLNICLLLASVWLLISTVQFSHAQAIPPNAQPFNPAGAGQPVQTQAQAPQLEDIHLPAEISAWPPAPGWFMLVLLVLLLSSAVLVLLLRQWLAARYRRYAAKELQTLFDEFNSGPATAAGKALFAQQSQQLIRRCALHCYGHAAVAALSGKAWLDFLARCDNSFDATLAESWLTACYSPDSDYDLPANYRQLQHWIRHHRANRARISASPASSRMPSEVARHA